MQQIAAGKGKAPKPFMLAKGGKTKADAVWHSNRGEAAEARREDARPASRALQRRSRRKSRRCLISSRRSFAHRSKRPPRGDGWCHEIKFDGYRVQLRVEDGEAALKTRKGLDWTDKFPAIAKEARRAAGRA